MQTKKNQHGLLLDVESSDGFEIVGQPCLSSVHLLFVKLLVLAGTSRQSKAVVSIGACHQYITAALPKEALKNSLQEVRENRES